MIDNIANNSTYMMNYGVELSFNFGSVAASDQCDWPHSVDCNFDPASVKKLSKPTYLYLTFDDGPNEGTPSVLRALKVKNNKMSSKNIPSHY